MRGAGDGVATAVHTHPLRPGGCGRGRAPPGGRERRRGRPGALVGGDPGSGCWAGSGGARLALDNHDHGGDERRAWLHRAGGGHHGQVAACDGGAGVPSVRLRRDLSAPPAGR
ncbi:MAG: hypothetical protein MZW92_01945 [Comamonadaceae bacterium]|nr:hypothetical protein [Comamonadaceae bacterium]